MFNDTLIPMLRTFQQGIKIQYQFLAIFQIIF